MNNSFGNIFRLTTFGESHGKAIGGIIDGCPAGHKIDLDLISYEMQRRKPGQSKIVTQRKEEDKVEFLSGIFEGKTTGTPIGFLIRNKDQRPNQKTNFEDFISVKGIKAQGNQLTPHKVKQIDLLEPLEYIHDLPAKKDEVEIIDEKIIDNDESSSQTSLF